MRDYFVTVFVLSLLMGTLERFLYEEKGIFGEKKALAVILVFSIAYPLPSLLNEEFEIPLFPDYSFDSEGIPEYEEVTKEAFEEGMKKEIADKFSLSVDSVNVYALGFSFEKLKAEKIRVVLSLSCAGVDPLKIEKYVNALEIGECEVYFEIG